MGAQDANNRTFVYSYFFFFFSVSAVVLLAAVGTNPLTTGPPSSFGAQSSVGSWSQTIGFTRSTFEMMGLLGCWKAYLLGGKVWPLPACTVTVMEVNIVGVYLVHMPSTSIDEYSWFLPQAAFSMLYEGAAWMLTPQWLGVYLKASLDEHHCAWQHKWNLSGSFTIKKVVYSSSS